MLTRNKEDTNTSTNDDHNLVTQMDERLRDDWNQSGSTYHGLTYEAGGVLDTSVPDKPVITNLDSLLADIYVRYIAMRAVDFRLYYRVFNSIFDTIHKNMKEVDPYYRRYSSTAQAAGSHYDRLRIKKPDEFDMDIVIRLPLNNKEDRFDPSNSDIKFEPLTHGPFVKLKMGKQFQRLPMRDKDDWQIHKAIYECMDTENYLLRNKFVDWFKSTVYKALNRLEGYGNYKSVSVDGIQYVIHTSESGPAITLKINDYNGFKMDVDLVPALVFPEERWPISDDYRDISTELSMGRYGWMVVPKPSKMGDGNRSWRFALHNQERKLMHGKDNLKQTIRYLKKLRDKLNMDEIASYYIKTLFFWEIIERQSDVMFWRQPPSKLFTIMVDRLYDALYKGNIPYFWNEDYNLIDGAATNILMGYANKLIKLKQILEVPANYKMVAEYLLTDDEYKKYKGILYG
ncbi:cyclic GMP-AMP synthase-like receptor [Aphomia sociella]